ncbi:hypothetical protein BGZ99_006498 [Dissophora globulifera]|uniref:Mid2 domain-containing protein n=1 Tax=Dissophora globulifera TaxID=979702 RepID=A0A9P6REB8_9FUNG|nr:hypothetical protein BGZ99_006498 [Dissophora globulifera]
MIDSVSFSSSSHSARRCRQPWTTWLCLSTALLLTLPALFTGASAAPASLHQSVPQKRAVAFVDPSQASSEVTFEANNNYFVQTLAINECVGGAKIVLPVSAADSNVRDYAAIMAVDPGTAINFYTDETCQEYEFSVVSEVHEFVGAFASLKYVGQFTGVTSGVYDKQEISKTSPPEEPLQTTATPSAAAPTSASASATPATSDPATLPAPGSSTTISSSAGFAVGVGIIGVVAMAGVVALGVVWYRKNGGGGAGRRGGDGRAFMTLSSGQDDYDDETGLTGENGPHTSSLMRSRVEASFEDERYPGTYNDEHASDDEEVELGAYPQNPAGPTQYRAEPGTLPQNARMP